MMNSDGMADEIENKEEVTDIASSIMGLSQTLLHELEAELSPAHRAQLTAIYNASKKLLVRFLEKNTTY